MAIIKANVTVRKYDKFGRLALERKAHNLVVNDGLDWFADRTHVDESHTLGTDCAYGSSGTAPSATDTALGSEYQSGTGTYTDTGTGTCTIDKTFNITATETAREAGLLATDDTLIARATYTEISLSNGDQLEIEWTITITDGG